MVAAVGNGGDAPTEPWRFAGYPAALPHVLGVGAYGRTGDVPSFSNRDDVYVDIAAPGQDMLSTAPALADEGVLVLPGPGLLELRARRSTAAPTAPRSPRRRSPPPPPCCSRSSPSLRPDQVSAILERTADDAHAGRRLRRLLDRARRRSPARAGSTSTAAIHALQGQLPRAGPLRAQRRRRARGAGRLRQGAARPGRRSTTWDDPNDVYRIRLTRGQGLSVVERSGPLDTSIVLWKPALQSLALATDSLRARRSIHPAGAPERIRYRARRAGWYYLQVEARDAGLGLVHAPHRLIAARPPGPRGSAAPGLPTTTARAGTSLSTTAPAPTNASSPISTPGRAPLRRRSRAPRRIVGPLIELVPLLGAAHEVVVRRDHAGRDEHVVLERRVRGDVRVAPGSSSARRSSCRSRRASRGRSRRRRRSCSARGRRPGRRRSRARRASSRRRRWRRSRRSFPRPSSSGGSCSRFAVERGESVGCLPTTA